METVDGANHADNQRRLTALEGKIDKLEGKIDRNTRITEQQVESTADLLEMWGDAGVFFKWMRRFGAFIVWAGKVVIGLGALWGIGHYFGGPK